MWENRGSSPRMWGTVVVFFFDYSFIRFIPTHVGNRGRGYRI